MQASQIFVWVKTKTFEHLNCKLMSTSHDPNSNLMKNREYSVTQLKYCNLMYLTNYTRPDIAYAISRLNCYIQSPNQDHWNTIYRVFKYLKATIDYGLCYSIFPNVVEED